MGFKNLRQRVSTFSSIWISIKQANWWNLKEPLTTIPQNNYIQFGGCCTCGTLSFWFNAIDSMCHHVGYQKLAPFELNNWSSYWSSFAYGFPLGFKIITLSTFCVCLTCNHRWFSLWIDIILNVLLVNIITLGHKCSH